MSHFAMIARGTAVALAACLEPTVAHAPAAESVERIATLGIARSVHTTTVLPSGELLVAGGMGAGGSAASAEVIDVSAATVTAVGAMAEARAGHTATALADGRVVVAGGYNGQYLASVEVYDPRRKQFAVMGKLNEGRSDHTATLLADGRILIIGGVGAGYTFLQTAELFDPATGRSQAVGSLSTPREGHTATLLTDGRILVVGGHQGRREAMEVYASAEVYDPATRRFDPTGHLTTARHKHDAVGLADGRVLVLGGADRTDRRYYATTEVYDPTTATFTAGPTMVSSRYKIAGTTIRLANGDVLVTSGARTAELLHHNSFTFHAVPGEFPMALHFSTATALSNGDVVIVGGYGDAGQNTAGVWRFRAR